MEVTREQVKEFIKQSSVMEIAALVKELEQELGVSAAVPRRDDSRPVLRATRRGRRRAPDRSDQRGAALTRLA